MIYKTVYITQLPQLQEILADGWHIQAVIELESHEVRNRAFTFKWVTFFKVPFKSGAGLR